MVQVQDAAAAAEDGANDGDDFVCGVGGVVSHLYTCILMPVKSQKGHHIP